MILKKKPTFVKMRAKNKRYELIKIKSLFWDNPYPKHVRYILFR
jgi:hypothetical protein